MRKSDNPLLGDSCQELDARIARYVEEHVIGAPEDPVEATRYFVATLGAAGLTAFLDRPSADAIDSIALCRTREMLAYHSAICDTAFAMQGLGAYPILLAGSEELRERTVAPVARGEKIASFAVTEPEAGSDVASIQTIAKKDKDRYLLNGTKTLISNAGIADFYTVFAKDGDEMIALVVEADSNGIAYPNPMELIAPHPIGEMVFDNCAVPAANWLAGDGFRIAMATLDRFRASVGAAALGLAGRALDEALARTRKRKQFGKRLCDMPTIRATIAEMYADLDASRMLVYKAAVHAKAGAPEASLAASTAKYFATEAAQRVVDKAVQLHGGSGVVKGNVVERLYREVRPLRLYEGTSEIQKAVIAKQILKSTETEEMDA